MTIQSKMVASISSVGPEVEYLVERVPRYQHALQLLKDASYLVMTDKEFRILSERAQKGQLCAGKLLEWISNEDKAGTFAMKLLESLQRCSHPRAVQFHTLKEHVWENYY